MAKTTVVKVLDVPTGSIAPDTLYLVKESNSVAHGYVSNKEGTGLVEVCSTPTVSGDVFAYVGYPNTYYITSWGLGKIYNVTSNDGDIVYNPSSPDSFTFTVTDPSKTSAKFKVGAEEFTVEVRVLKPIAPIITYPLNDTSGVLYKGLLIETAGFALNSDIHNDNQTATDWQIATDPGFNDIVFSSMNDQSNLINIVVP